jgi:hypothetical protein
LKRVDADDEKERSPIDGDVPAIGEDIKQPADMRHIIVFTVPLLNQEILVLSVPTPRPIVVCPAETEGKLGTAGGQHLVEGSVQEAPTVKPIVVMAEPTEAVFLRQVCLRVSRFRKAKVVEAQVGWDVGLVVSSEQRSRFRDVGPFREPLSPPIVVLGDRIELG